jgi:hypothetical protein
LRPHPPHRPQDPGDAGASALARPLRASRKLPPGTSRGFTSQGPMGCLGRACEPAWNKPAGASRFSGPRSLRAFRPSAARDSMFASRGGCGGKPPPRPAMRAHESFAPTRSARTPHVTTPSRHRLEADTALERCRRTSLCPREKA